MDSAKMLRKRLKDEH